MLPVPYQPPPPPPPPSFDSGTPSISDGGDGHSGAPSLLIIAGIIAFVIVASAAIHLLLRLISSYRSSSSSTSSSSPPSPTPLLLNLPSAANSGGGGGGGVSPPSDRDQLIASLPLFSIASSVAAAPKSSSLDCAVCLSAFRPHDELRLLPACRHAFHSQCVDTWLRSTPSCPLCRSSIHLPPPPPPQPPEAVNLGHSRSGSFRVELGSVSRRRLSAEGISAAAGGGAAHGRSYSLGSSFEYLVEEEVEAVLERLRKEKPDNVAVGGVPAAPGAEVAEVAGGSGRGWLRDCVDRLASSASSSFNSLRFSSRYGSRRFESASAGAAGGGGRSWDLEENSFVQWEEESEFGMFYRWLIGV